MKSYNAIVARTSTIQKTTAFWIITVRCGQKHAIEACERDIHPVKCVNCGENHTPNFKGCVVYQQTVRRRKNLSSQGNALPQKTSTKRTTVRSEADPSCSNLRTYTRTNSLHWQPEIGGLTSNINQMTSLGYGNKPYRRQRNNNTQRPAISSSSPSSNNINEIASNSKTISNGNDKKKSEENWLKNNLVTLLLGLTNCFR